MSLSAWWRAVLRARDYPLHLEQARVVLSELGGDAGTEEDLGALLSSAQALLRKREAPREEPSPPDAPEVKIVAPDNVDFRPVQRAIEISDWLERAGTETKISRERAIEVASRKSGELCAQLGLERVEEQGEFNAGIQQIVDTVATADAAENMRVAETVQCGYRIGAQLLRPQKVLVYRYAEDITGS